MATALHILAAESEKFEAHNPMLPETKEIVLGGISFLIIAFALWKFGLPGAKKGYAARTERIAKQLDDAQAAKSAADADVAAVRASLAGADAEAARIIEEARQSADSLRASADDRIGAELDEIRAKAMADIETAKARTAGELEARIATLSIGAAERVVTGSLDGGTQQDLIEQFISTVGSTRV